MPQYVVKASFGHDADDWHVEDTDVPGLSTKAATFEAFCRNIEVMVPELLEANAVEAGQVEIIARSMANLGRSAA